MYETLTTRLRTEYYGELLPVTAYDDNLSLPFNPLEEAKFALKHRGYYPLTKVVAALLPAVDKFPNQEEVTESHVDEPEELLEEIHGDLDEPNVDDEDDDERIGVGVLSDDEGDLSDEGELEED